MTMKYKQNNVNSREVHFKAKIKIKQKSFTVEVKI